MNNTETHEPQKPAPIRSTDGLERNGIFLQIDYQRISPTDKCGMVDVACEGDEAWVYADVGSHHGAQCENSDAEKRVMAFGAKLSALVKEHFGAVRPILDEEPGRSKRMRSNVKSCDSGDRNQ